MTKVSAHLTLEELRCHDGTDYPNAWRETRLPTLATAFEIVRALHDLPVVILSGYRTRAYNKEIGGAPRSQHCEGRALDLRPPEVVPLVDWWEDIRRIAHRAGITGIGYAAPSKGGYVHIDVRPSPTLKMWRY